MIEIKIQNDQQFLALHDAVTRAEAARTKKASKAKATIEAALMLTATREALGLVRDAAPDHLREVLGLGAVDDPTTVTGSARSAD